jgi:predicted permease
MLLILMGALGMVLLVACANAAGLLVARGIARRSELAVRASLGASRGRLAAQLITESVVLAVPAGLCGLVLSVWLQRLLPIATGLADSGVVARGVEGPVLLFALAASLVTGVLSGVAPGLRASSLHLAANLGPGGRATYSRGGARLRRVLVVGQVALSLVLLVGAGLLLRSFGRLAATDLGFNSGGLLVASIDQPFRDDDARLKFQAELRDDLAGMAGVQATLTSHVPIRHPAGDPPMWPAKRSATDASAQYPVLARIVAPGYFHTVGIPLVAGRDLTAADRRGTAQVMVIDEHMAGEFFPDENPIGQHVMAMGMVVGDGAPRDFEVVGVVGSARLNSAAGNVQATAYVSSYQFGMGRINVMLRTPLTAAAVTSTLRRLMAAKHPDIPVEPVVPMDTIVDEALLSRRVIAVTLGAFSAMALGLAAMGLYGVLAFYVTQRRHEIGIRLALGADHGVILRQVLWHSAWMVGPGLAVGLAASLAGARLMTRFLYQVEPTDAVTYAGVSVTLAAAALAASAWPAWRAARVNPLVALRGE